MKEQAHAHTSGCRLAPFFWSFWIAAWNALWVWASLRLQFPTGMIEEQRPLWHAVWVASTVAFYLGVVALRLQRRLIEKKADR